MRPSRKHHFAPSPPGARARLRWASVRSSPTTAAPSIAAFVTMNTRLPTKALYTTKPVDDAISPMKSQIETPLLVLSRHCLRTCVAIVQRSKVELSQPMAWIKGRLQSHGHEHLASTGWYRRQWYATGAVDRHQSSMTMKMALVGGCFVVGSLSLGACRQDKPAEGPAERAGQKVDRAAEKTKEAGKDAVDATKYTAGDAKKNVEKKTDKKD
jgi:hypothetical protein